MDFYTVHPSGEDAVRPQKKINQTESTKCQSSNTA
jgi:hypothetical protein